MLISLSILLGILMLYYGAELVVKGATYFAVKYQVSPLIFGVTVVAFGTSLPEAVTSFTAQLDGHRSDICLGNIIGSNIANLGLILGASGLLFPLPIREGVRKREAWLCILMTVVIYGMMLFGAIGALQGALLLALFLAYVVYQVFLAKQKSSKEVKTNKEAPPWLIPLGIILLCMGGYFLVSGSVALAEAFGVSERVIGLTIVAVGTSCPELFTSLVAAYRKQSDLAIGNVIGSNIFNLSFVLGGGAIIHPIRFSPQLLQFDTSVLLAFTLFFLLITQFFHKVGRISSFLLLAGYIVYLMYLGGFGGLS